MTALSRRLRRIEYGLGCLTLIVIVLLLAVVARQHTGRYCGCAAPAPTYVPLEPKAATQP